LKTSPEVTQPDQWQTAVAFTVRTFGWLHILVNYAGVASAVLITAFKLEVWRKTLNVDLR
jgi:3alpha(or 20beta)-hydroxysteroid dehydrogenase